MKLISPKFIYHGLESTQEIKNILGDLNVKKVYLLCDPILKEINAVKKVTGILDSKGIEYVTSTNVMAEPSVEIGNEIVKEVREANPDLIIGLGGGSTIDLAKAASLVAPQAGNIENYLNLTGDLKLDNRKIPNILMPSDRKSVV